MRSVIGCIFFPVLSCWARFSFQGAHREPVGRPMLRSARWAPTTARKWARAFGSGDFRQWPLFDCRCHQLYHDHRQHALPGDEHVSLAVDGLGAFVTAILLLLAVPVLSAAAAMLFCDLNAGTKLLPAGRWRPAASLAAPLLVFRPPGGLYLILPAMGSPPTSSRFFHASRFSATRPMVYAICHRVLGFIVWGHHMFVSGMNPTLGAAFSVATMIIAVPSAIKSSTGWERSGAARLFTTAMSLPWPSFRCSSSAA